MPDLNMNIKKERISFFLEAEFAQKINKIADEVNLTVSELTRKALDSYIKKIEKEKIDKELESGYQANYNYYLKSESEWQYADKE
jgi:hypothetical protein